VARIDLEAVKANVRFLRLRLGVDVELCAVVKADAYGHGALPCALAALEGGATRLAVATASEATELKSAFRDVPVLVMGCMTGGEMDAAVACGAEVGVPSPESLLELSARASALGRRASVHVKYDSGMGRLGVSDPREFLQLVAGVADDPQLDLAGVWTHFATADNPTSPHFDVQLLRFEELSVAVKASYPDVTCHAANSAATLRDPRSHFDMARCGVAIYGLDPFQHDPASIGLSPALSLVSYLANVRRFSRSQSVGYGRTWTASRDTFIGLIPLGYGDGVRRSLAGRASVLVGGRRRPIVGAISMDSLTVDLGSELDVRRGDEAVLIGAQGAGRVLAEELAMSDATINYEITCAIAKRVPREFATEARASCSKSTRK
jgi:alanine racemase